MPYIAQRQVEGGGAPILTPEEEALLAAEGEVIPPPDTSMYAAPVEAQYQVGGENYVAPYDPGAQYGMGSSGGDPAVTYAQNQPTDQYNTAPSGTYPSDPIPAPAQGDPNTSSGSAMYGAGGVDAFNGGYPVAAGTQAMGFDPDPTTVPPPPTANTGGGASTYYGGSDSAYRQGGAMPNSKEISTLYPASGGPTNLRVIPPPRENRYNFDAAEPGPPKPVPDTSPIATPDMQPIEEALGNAIPAAVDSYSRFFGPIAGMPGSGRGRGDSARAAQDAVGGMILPDLEKPISRAGQAGRQAGQVIDPLIDRAAEGILSGAQNLVRLSTGVSANNKSEPSKALRPSGGIRAMREQEPIPAPAPSEPSIPDRMGSWLQTEVVQPSKTLDPALAGLGDWIDKNVINPPAAPKRQDSASQRGSTPPPIQPGAYNPSTNPQSGADWDGASTRSLELMKSYSPQDWTAGTRRSAVEIDGVPRKLIESTARPGLYVGYIDGAGNVVPVGNDVPAEQFVALVIANAAEAPPDWGDVAPPSGDTAAPSVEIPTPAASGGTTLEDVSISAPSDSGGGNSSWNDNWSSGSSKSSGKRSSWDDFDNGFDGGREFTADDFLDAAEGDYRKAERMARMANKRRKRKGSSATDTGSGFWDGFPFGRPPTPMREYILTAIAESKAAGQARKQQR